MSKLISCQLIIEKKGEKSEAFPPTSNSSTRGRDNWFRSVGKFSFRHLNFQLTKRSGAYSRRNFLDRPPLSNQFASSSRNSYSSRRIPSALSANILQDRFISTFPFDPRPTNATKCRPSFKNFLAFSIRSFPIVSSWISYVICCLNYPIFFFFLWLPPRGLTERISRKRELKLSMFKFIDIMCLDKI